MFGLLSCRLVYWRVSWNVYYGCFIHVKGGIMRLTQALTECTIAYADTKHGRYFSTDMECFKEIKDGKKKRIVKVDNLNEIMGLNWKSMGHES